MSRPAGRTRLGDDAYRALALERGLVWLGPAVETVRQPTTWRCEHGHEWQTRYATLKGGRSGCPECWRLSRIKQPEDYHALAAQHGWLWLGPVVETVKALTTWRCGRFHVFERSYANARKNGRCPVCRCHGSHE